jgi:hypothetical protein
MSSRRVVLSKLSSLTAFAALGGALTTLLPGRAAQAEAQPHMRNALEALRTARAQLQQATADKGGHRVSALNHVNAAIDQVQKGIAFDNRR